MILALLQNAYTSSEESALRLEKLFANPDLIGPMQARRKEGLFDGANYTGLTIKRIFGEKLCDSIWWENACPRWGWLSSHKFPADMDHLRKLCVDLRPDVVLTFGKVATDAIRDLHQQADTPIEHAELISGPHPAARMPDKWDRLRAMNAALQKHITECQHCGLFPVSGSHCDLCFQSLEWKENPIA